jgi:hypothetical protein
LSDGALVILAPLVQMGLPMGHAIALNIAITVA